MFGNIFDANEEHVKSSKTTGDISFSHTCANLNKEFKNYK